MYSGNTKNAIIIIRDTAKANVLKQYFKINIINPTPQYYINIQDWAIKEMKVPAYPEQRVYNEINIFLQSKMDTNAFEFYIR